MVPKATIEESVLLRMDSTDASDCFCPPPFCLRAGRHRTEKSRGNNAEPQKGRCSVCPGWLSRGQRGHPFPCLVLEGWARRKCSPAPSQRGHPVCLLANASVDHWCPNEVRVAEKTYEVDELGERWET